VNGEPSGLGPDFLAGLAMTTETERGAVYRLAPVLELSETPPRWDRPTAPLGGHPPVWPERVGTG